MKKKKNYVFVSFYCISIIAEIAEIAETEGYCMSCEGLAS